MKNSGSKELLILGIGNDSRQDDGLGWALLDLIERNYPGKYQLEYAYQLNIEDADRIKELGHVLFIDACSDEKLKGASIEKCLPDGRITFSTHALDPEAILALSLQVYGSLPEAHILKLKGYEWELKTGLTEQGKESLAKGLEIFELYRSEEAFVN